MIEEHRLDPTLHDRAGFDCGVPPLNEYLKRYAAQDLDRGYSRSYVLVDSDTPARILGYYALSAAQIDATELTDADRRRIPRYPVPCIRIGRLAVDRRQQGSGMGRRLTGAAIIRCLAVQAQIGAYAVIVDAKDDNAIAFYEHYGFVRFASRPDSLYLPLRSAEDNE